MPSLSRRTELILLLLILLIAGALRFTALEAVPPGMTHDEADHGIDAAGVLDGIRPMYFTVGYGREPLFDYSTAPMMLLVGRNYLAGRLTAGLYSMALLVLLYLWIRMATRNPWLALGTTALLAVSFWGVQVGRHALRTITLPALFMAAAAAMWASFEFCVTPCKPNRDGVEEPRLKVKRVGWMLVAGVLLGLSLYTYLAARGMWLVFPAMMIFFAVFHWKSIRDVLPASIGMLVIAGLIAAPLFIYLSRNPDAETRVGQLSGPVDALMAGDPAPLLGNIRAGLGMIFIRGDDLWLYNIPGKPLLGPVLGVLFVIGILAALMHLIAPYAPTRRGHSSPQAAFSMLMANSFMLLTLTAGLSPALITGISASNTRVIGLMPALYYFPVLGVMALSEWAYRSGIGKRGFVAIWTAFLVLIAATAGFTIRDYFVTWANHPDVRVAYHTTLDETLSYLEDHPEIGPDVAISSITPSRVHDPAVAAMRLNRDDLYIRWFDGRNSIVIPAGESTVFLSDFAPLQPEFDPVIVGYIEAEDWLTLRPDDRNATVHILHLSAMPGDERGPMLGDALELRDVTVVGEMTPGATVDILTTWQITAQSDSEVVLFTHVLAAGGQLVAQDDILGVPASSWVIGDRFIQRHRVTLPAETDPASLRFYVGAYTRPEIVRWPAFDAEGGLIGDMIPLPLN